MQHAGEQFNTIYNHLFLMTVAFAQLSAGGSLTVVSGMIDTESPLAEQLLKLTPGGRLQHGHNLTLPSRRPELHSNMSSIYKQLLEYLKGRHEQIQQNVINLPTAECTCSFDVVSSQEKFTQAVIKKNLVILGLWMTFAAFPLYKKVYQSLIKGCSTCDVYLLVSGSLEFYIKLGTLPGHRLDYVFSATGNWISQTCRECFLASYTECAPNGNRLQ